MAEHSDKSKGKNVKSESQSSISKQKANTTRLLSFRSPRDLTLGLNIKNSLASNVKPRKTFTPNIPAKRERNTEKNVERSTQEKKKYEKKPAGSRIFNQVKRDRVELIQTPGVLFGEGIDTSQKPHRYAASRESSTEAPQYNSIKIPEQKLEKEALDELLRSDFVDDLEDSGDRPLQLPMREPLVRKVCKTTVKPLKIKEEPEDNIACAAATLLELSNGFSDSNLEFKPDVKPKVLPHTEESLSDIFMGNSRSNFLLFQFPDSIPTLGTIPEDAKDAEHSKEGPACNLKNLPEGRFGTLKIYKSGAAKIVMENGYMLDVHIGTTPSCLQSLAALKINSDKNGGKLTMVGQVDQKLICAPDWNQLMS